MPANVNINEETILKRYESLPDDLKQALMGVTTADAIYEIGKRAGLNIEKMGLLSEEVGLIILGFIPTENFISDLKTILEINEERAENIASEVNSMVFTPIRESLKQIHGSSWTEGITKPPVQFGPRQGAPNIPVKPAAASPVEAKSPPVPPQPTTPKEPLIIKPMSVGPIAPRQETVAEEFFKQPPSLMQEVKTTPAAEPKRIPVPPIRPPLPRQEGEPVPSSETKIVSAPTSLPVAEKKEPMDYLPQTQEQSPVQKISVPPPAQVEPQSVAPKISVPPPAPRALGIDPYREPVE